MKANDRTSVSVIYTLEVEGVVRDSCSKENPLHFVMGAGTLLPRFEGNVRGKEPGDKFDFTLAPADGYGEYDNEAVVDLPRNIFAVEGKEAEELLKEGNVIPMMTNDGRVVRGTVKEVSSDKVKMDFNHELAGATLHFTGEVVEVREATEEELNPHKCSGNCSDCGGGCH